MIHYANGKLVAGSVKPFSNGIYVHKICIDWYVTFDNFNIVVNGCIESEDVMQLFLVTLISTTGCYYLISYKIVLLV